MLITHRIKKTKISRNIQNTLERNNSLFLLDRRGHYLALAANSQEQISNYYGWAHVISKGNEYSMYKVIDNISIDASPKDGLPKELVNNFTSVERKYSVSTERFSLVRDGLIYSASSYNGQIIIDLDFREINDYDDTGRIYRISNVESSDTIVVEYAKYTDNTLSVVEKKYYLAIKGAKNYSSPDAWIKRYYNYDASRGSRSEFYVYRALKIECRKNISLMFAFSEDRDEAIKKVGDIDEEQSDKLSTRYIDNVLTLKNNIGKEIGNERAFAYVSCIHAIEGLSTSLSFEGVHHRGLWAGLPWFYQYWARDELISSHSLLLEHRYNYTKDQLLKYLDKIMPDGRLPNRYPESTLGNADGIGWLFKRLSDFLDLCEKRDNFDMYFTLYDIQKIREKLESSIKLILQNHSKDGLITNANLETWMDTHFSGDAYDRDFRSGARIEIQSLFLSMLRFMNRLDNYLSNKFVKKDNQLIKLGSEKYSKMEHDFRKLVKERFFVESSGKKVLNDGYDCEMHDVARPNIFLAYYIYPELLEPVEWESAFDHVLPKLWCDWELGSIAGGGLSTIDKNNTLYQEHYTGINNRSYHRGDSWFFVNNIAAISMYRLNKEKYSSHITKILNSSSEDILFNGFSGYASELSSSGHFRSGGCFCQTWSIATFIEMMHEFYIE